MSFFSENRLIISQITTAVLILLFMPWFLYLPLHFLATLGDSRYEPNFKGLFTVIIITSLIGGIITGLITGGLQLILIGKYISYKILWIIINVCVFILGVFFLSCPLLFSLSNGSLSIFWSRFSQAIFLLINVSFTAIYLFCQWKFLRK